MREQFCTCQFRLGASLRMALVFIFSTAHCFAGVGAARFHVQVVEGDADSVTQGTVADFTFPVRNTGDATLTLEVKTSCGCTVAEYDKTIEPGKEGVIRAKLDTKGMKGLVRKSLTVLTNDPEHKSTTLWISVNVETPIDIFPQDKISGSRQSRGKQSRSTSF